MTEQEIATHLIQEDLKYHQLVHHLSLVDLHLEYYPDFATAVQHLLYNHLDSQKEEAWLNTYTREICKAKDIDKGNPERLNLLSSIICELLKP